MLRINLLPPYVSQRRLTRKLVPAFIAVFALCVAAPLAVYFYLHNQLVALTQQASDAVAGKAKTDSYKAEATTTLAQVGPITAKLKFVDADYAYIRKWVALYNTLADTTPKSSFIYTGATVTGATMAIKAYSPSVEEVGRYLQVMYHEPDFTTVAVDHIPAYPDNIRHLYYYNGVLVFADGATGSGSAAAQGGGFTGGPAGGQAGAGAPANYPPAARGPNGPANTPPGVGPPPPELAGDYGAAGAGGRAGSPGVGSPGGGTQAGTYSEKFLAVAGRNISPFATPAIRELLLQKALHHVVRKTVSRGFDINVTATLKEPLTPPALPGSAPAGGAAPGRFPGGPPGGFPGGPPGGRPA